jgi:hypothetical protein
MTRKSRHLLEMLAGLGVLAVASMLASSAASAAQPYWCVCKGEKKRFLASTKKCEHDFKVKSCSSAQFAKFNALACKSNGCTVGY